MGSDYDTLSFLGGEILNTPLNQIVENLRFQGIKASICKRPQGLRNMHS